MTRKGDRYWSAPFSRAPVVETLDELDSHAIEVCATGCIIPPSAPVWFAGHRGAHVFMLRSRARRLFAAVLLRAISLQAFQHRYV